MVKTRSTWVDVTDRPCLGTKRDRTRIRPGIIDKIVYNHFPRKSAPMIGGPSGRRSGPDGYALRTATSSTGRHPQCTMSFPVRHDRYRAGNGRRMIAVSISKDCGSRHNGLLRKSGLDYIRPCGFLLFILTPFFVSDPFFFQDYKGEEGYPLGGD